MTRAKKTGWDAAVAACGGLTALMAANVEALEAAPEIALDWFPGDELLRRAVEARDVPMVVARVMELTMRETPVTVAKLEASMSRSAATAARNRKDAAETRAAALKRFDRLMAAGDRTEKEALTLGWPDRHARNRVRGWIKTR